MPPESKTLELDETSKKFFISVLGNCRQVMNAVDESQLSEPWISHYRKIKSDYDSVLKELSPSDQVMAALDANRHLSCLYSMLASTNSMCSMLTNNMAEMKKNAVNALNSAVDAAVTERITKGELIPKTDVDSRVKTGIDAEIANRTKTGDLVPKDQHTQLCSAAKDIGIQEGRTAAEKAVAAEKATLETISKRKTLLATNGIPLPTKDIEKLLGGTDAEFETRQTDAKTRMEQIMGRGVALNSDHSIWHNIWLDAEAYKTFEALVGQLASGEPFAGGSRSGTAPVTPMLV